MSDPRDEGREQIVQIEPADQAQSRLVQGSQIFVGSSQLAGSLLHPFFEKLSLLLQCLIDVCIVDGRRGQADEIGQANHEFAIRLDKGMIPGVFCRVSRHQQADGMSRFPAQAEHDVLVHPKSMAQRQQVFLVTSGGTHHPPCARAQGQEGRLLG